MSERIHAGLPWRLVRAGADSDGVELGRTWGGTVEVEEEERKAWARRIGGGAQPGMGGAPVVAPLLGPI